MNEKERKGALVGSIINKCRAMIRHEKNGMRKDMKECDIEHNFHLHKELCKNEYNILSN